MRLRAIWIPQQDFVSQRKFFSHLYHLEGLHRLKLLAVECCFPDQCTKVVSLKVLCSWTEHWIACVVQRSYNKCIYLLRRGFLNLCA